MYKTHIVTALINCPGSQLMRVCCGLSGGGKQKLALKEAYRIVCKPAKTEMVSAPGEAKYREVFNTNDGWFKSISTLHSEINA